MELKDEPDELVAFPGELVIAQVRHRFGFDHNRSGIGRIEQAEHVKQCAFPAARRADYGVNCPRLEIERYFAQRVHASLLLAKIALNISATQRYHPIHSSDVGFFSFIRLSRAGSQPVVTQPRVAPGRSWR